MIRTIFGTISIVSLSLLIYVMSSYPVFSKHETLRSTQWSTEQSDYTKIGPEVADIYAHTQPSNLALELSVYKNKLKTIKRQCENGIQSYCSEVDKIKFMIAHLEETPVKFRLLN